MQFLGKSRRPRCLYRDRPFHQGLVPGRDQSTHLVHLGDATNAFFPLALTELDWALDHFPRRRGFIHRLDIGIEVFLVQLHKDIFFAVCGSAHSPLGASVTYQVYQDHPLSRFSSVASVSWTISSFLASHPRHQSRNPVHDV